MKATESKEHGKQSFAHPLAGRKGSHVQLNGGVATPFLSNRGRVDAVAVFIVHINIKMIVVGVFFII